VDARPKVSTKIQTTHIDTWRHQMLGLEKVLSDDPTTSARKSAGAGGSAGATILHYQHHFVDLIQAYVTDRPIRIVADIGTGDGWLALGLALFTPYRVIALDLDTRRLSRTRLVAQKLGVSERITWISASTNRLPFPDQAIDVSFCVEVLEHAVDQQNAVHELARVTRQLLVVSTPNRLFPIINHDTKLPFCHWLPLNWRDRYATAMGRQDYQHSNHFLAPSDLTVGLAEFRRVSGFLQFPSYAAYQEATGAPPEGSLAARLARLAKDAYLSLAGRIGCGHMHIMPNLASAWLRQRL
jgi:SAM-dependent methyltransferase